MAKATGFTCDNPGCSRFVATNDKAPLPPGWMHLICPTPQDVRDDGFDLCSNRCLRMLATEREKAERPTSNPTPDSDGRKRVGHRVSHVDRGIVNPDCEYCQAETAPNETEGRAA